MIVWNIRLSELFSAVLCTTTVHSYKHAHMFRRSFP